MRHAGRVDRHGRLRQLRHEEARGGLRVVVRHPEGPGHVVARARGHQSQRHVRPGDEVHAGVEHAVPAHDDERVGAPGQLGGRGADEGLVARLAERHDVVARGGEGVDHLRADAAAAAGRGGGVDGHDDAERVHTPMMAPRLPGGALPGRVSAAPGMIEG